MAANYLQRFEHNPELNVQPTLKQRCLTQYVISRIADSIKYQLWLKKLACAAAVLSSLLTFTFGGVSKKTLEVTLSILP